MRRLLPLLGIILLSTGSWFLHAGTLAQFRSALGDIEVELYDQDKPTTVQNFIRYVQSGAFQNEFSHRLQPSFVLQGGGFTVTNRGTTNWTILSIPSFPPITNEFAVGRRFSNLYGTIAMAKLGGCFETFRVSYLLSNASYAQRGLSFSSEAITAVSRAPAVIDAGATGREKRRRK